MKNNKRDPRVKFVQLAESRVNSAIRTIRLIGNLSNQSSYTYSDKDVEKIFRSLEEELKIARLRFKSGTKKEGSSFKL